MPRKTRDRDKEKAWYHQWWAKRGRALRKLRRITRKALTRAQKDRKNAMTKAQRAAMTEDEVVVYLKRRRARYAAKVVQAPQAPRSSFVPKTTVAELELYRRQRELRLAYLQSLKYPPRAREAGSAARMARHFAFSLLA